MKKLMKPLVLLAFWLFLVISLNGCHESTSKTIFETIAIESWDMDFYEHHAVFHNLGKNFTKIIYVQAFVYPDDIPSEIFPIDTVQLGKQAGCIESIDETRVTLWRTNEGFFDSVYFDDTSINRGYLTIGYSL